MSSQPPSDKKLNVGGGGGQNGGRGKNVKKIHQRGVKPKEEEQEVKKKREQEQEEWKADPFDIRYFDCQGCKKRNEWKHFKGMNDDVQRYCQFCGMKRRENQELVNEVLEGKGEYKLDEIHGFFPELSDELFSMEIRSDGKSGKSHQKNIDWASEDWKSENESSDKALDEMLSKAELFSFSLGSMMNDQQEKEKYEEERSRVGEYNRIRIQNKRRKQKKSFNYHRPSEEYRKEMLLQERLDANRTQVKKKKRRNKKKKIRIDPETEEKYMVDEHNKPAHNIAGFVQGEQMQNVELDCQEEIEFQQAIRNSQVVNHKNAYAKAAGFAPISQHHETYTIDPGRADLERYENFMATSHTQRQISQQDYVSDTNDPPDWCQQDYARELKEKREAEQVVKCLKEKERRQRKAQRPLHIRQPKHNAPNSRKKKRELKALQKNMTPELEECLLLIAQMESTAESQRQQDKDVYNQIDISSERDVYSQRDAHNEREVYNRRDVFFSDMDPPRSSDDFEESWEVPYNSGDYVRNGSDSPRSTSGNEDNLSPIMESSENEDDLYSSIYDVHNLTLEDSGEFYQERPNSYQYDLPQRDVYRQFSGGHVPKQREYYEDRPNANTYSSQSHEASPYTDQRSTYYSSADIRENTQPKHDKRNQYGHANIPNIQQRPNVNDNGSVEKNNERTRCPYCRERILVTNLDSHLESCFEG